MALRYLISILLVCAASNVAFAEEQTSYSHAQGGVIGLNTVPSARMEENGVLAAGVSTLDPYFHSYIGFQIAEPLYISLRQSALTSNILHDADRLYPGMDTKIRLLKEDEFLPDISLGLNSAVGHKRMSAEYIAFSKRYHQFDFTAGLGWGRMGSAGHINNPFKSISNHFGKNRLLDDELSAGPENWFTGEKVGFFGGVEYFPSTLPPLSLKADFGADRYAIEESTSDFNAPVPWSVGFNFKPAEWVNFGVAVHSLDKLMARLTFRTKPKDWGLSDVEKPLSAHYFPERTTSLQTMNMLWETRKNGIPLYGARAKNAHLKAGMDLRPFHSTPRQLRIAATNMANNAGPDIEAITLYPRSYNLKGPAITLNRRDLENALARKEGSAAEIWRNAEITTEGKKGENRPARKFLTRPGYIKLRDINFTLDNQISMAEKDSATLYRTALITKMERPFFLNFLHMGSALRLNLHDNLDEIKKIRPPAYYPVRSDVYDFADRKAATDSLYLTASYSLTPEIHAAITGGYLEEMYGGAGGEILYRPFGKRFAIGADAWMVGKRNPFTLLNLGFADHGTKTGHLNVWYDFPEHDTVLKARFGRYLAQDIGGSLSIARHFENGASLEGSVTITDKEDYDLFGGTTHAYSGLRLSMPLGSIPFIPDGSRINVSALPFGRDTGQALQSPFSLYEATEPLSYDHIARHWHEIAE